MENQTCHFFSSQKPTNPVGHLPKIISCPTTKFSCLRHSGECWCTRTIIGPGLTAACTSVTCMVLMRSRWTGTHCLWVSRPLRRRAWRTPIRASKRMNITSHPSSRHRRATSFPSCCEQTLDHAPTWIRSWMMNSSHQVKPSTHLLSLPPSFLMTLGRWP